MRWRAAAALRVRHFSAATSTRYCRVSTAAAAASRYCRVSTAAAAAAATGTAVACGSVESACGLAVAAPLDDEDDPDGDNLRTWLEQRGASVTGVRFRQCNDDPAKGRGAFLLPGAESRNRGLLLKLPRNLVLTAERAVDILPELKTLQVQARTTDSPLAAALADERAGPPLLLTLFVLHSRLSPGAENGEWADYIAALPFNFDTPVLWPRDSAAVECIAGTPLDAAVAAKHSWLSHLQHHLPSALREAGGALVSLADALEQEPDGGNAALQWADAVVWSRGVAVPRQGGSGAPNAPGGANRKWEQLSLLPGLDMCNHVGGDGANASWVPADDGAVELRRIVQTPNSRTTRLTDAGEDEELTISYGDKTGEEFLFLYGFLPPDNPDDMVVLPLPALNQLESYFAPETESRVVQRKSDRLIQLQAQALSVLAGVGDDERDLQAATSAVGRLQLPTGPRLSTGPDRPGAMLQAVLDTMRVLVLREEDCFQGMGPARVGAWLEAGGGKFSREVDMRAIQLLRAMATQEITKMRPVEQTAIAAQAVRGRSDSPAMQLSLAVRYVDMRRELLYEVIRWCDVAVAGVSKDGVWWWKD